MTTTTTTLETLTANLDYWTALRRNLRSEASRTVDAKSRNDRLAECDRITRRIEAIYARMDTLD